MYFAAFGVRAIPSARDILVLLRVLVVLDKKVPLKFFDLDWFDSSRKVRTTRES